VLSKGIKMLLNVQFSILILSFFIKLVNTNVINLIFPVMTSFTCSLSFIIYMIFLAYIIIIIGNTVLFSTRFRIKILIKKK